MLPMLAGVLLLAPSAYADYRSDLDGVAMSLVKALAGGEPATVAVSDFTDLQGNVTELGRFLAEELSVSLSIAGGKQVRVVDRTHLKSIMKEHQLVATGLIDPSTARKLGKIAGVEALVTGTLTAFGDSVRLSVKLLNTTSAEIIVANRTNLAKTQALEELLERSVETVPETAAGGGPPTKASTGGSPVRSQPEARVPEAPVVEGEVSGYHFRLVDSYQEGSTLHVTALVSNQEADRNLTLASSYNREGSRVFDSAGNEVRASMVALGSARKEGNGYVRNLLIKGIPTRVQAKFDGMESGAQVIMIEFFGWDDKGKPVRVQLRMR